ncbi:MAG TPA: riboflavin synthase, partial [Alphaproteobacteria bacterium]|nr:riboflavin synthase [Alphaproteobacteria bacterium]
MFTGIVTDIGRVRAVKRAAGRDARFVIETAYDTSGIAVGASIACGGCCLTAVETGKGWFAADASAETLGCTTLGNWLEGTRINLERALKAGDELGGHLVSGH